MKKPPFITPTCGHPSHREPLRIGEINYTAQQINELLSLIPDKADKKEVFPNDSYLGHFPMGAQLPDMDRFAWAFVGDLDKAHPYFYYPKSNVPQGYQSGWNDMAKEFGTYLLTPGKQDQLTAEELFKEKLRLPQLTADRAIADEHGNRITDTYVRREAVANHIKQIYNQQFLDNPPLITEGYITPEMLSEETKQMLENTGQEITNLPDGEDLQSVHGVLKLADKQYNPNSYSGLGRRILRKNIVAGVNVLTQSMMQWPNTIYIIQYDYDLQGETITVPENCVLQFEGGMLSNGTIVGSNTNIKSERKCFFSIKLLNFFEVNLGWFTNIRTKNKECSSEFQEFVNSLDTSIYGINAVIPGGEYYIGNSSYELTDVNMICYGKFYTRHTEELIPSFRFKNSQWEKRLNIKGLKIYAIDEWNSSYNGVGIEIVNHNISMTDCEVFYHNYGLITKGWAHTYVNCTYLANNINIATSVASEMDAPYGSNANAASIFIGGQCTAGRKYNVVLGDADVNGKEQGAIPSSAAISFKGIAFDGSTFLVQGVRCLSIEDSYFENVTEGAAIIIGEGNGIIKISGNYFNGLKYGVKVLENKPLEVLDIKNNYFINIVGVAVVLSYSIDNPIVKNNYYHSSSLLKQKVYTPVPPHYNYSQAGDFIRKRYTDIVVDSWDYSSSVRKMEGNDIKMFEKYYISYYPCFTYLTDGYTLASAIFNIEDCICTPLPGYSIRDFNGGDMITINGILGFISGIDFENNKIILPSIFKSLKGEFPIDQKGVSMSEIFNNMYNPDGSIKSKVVQVRELKQISGGNKTFQIIDNLDLGGGSLNLGGYVTLDFSLGGKISNGSIRLNATRVIPNGCDITEYITADITGGYLKGQCLYDPVLGKPKWYNGSKWVDATGAEV